MNYLLDTNVVSEWVKPRPDSGLANWLAEADEDRLFLSVVTLADLRRGIERLSPGARRIRLDEWLQNELRARFESRIVPVDEFVADECGTIIAKRESDGAHIGVMDAFIAATAVVHQLTLVTRNVRDFRAVLPSLVSPWSS